MAITFCFFESQPPLAPYYGAPFVPQKKKIKKKKKKKNATAI
jgi:hypothetical protein